LNTHDRPGYIKVDTLNPVGVPLDERMRLQEVKTAQFAQPERIASRSRQIGP
jgi:hypothetical protein